MKTLFVVCIVLALSCSAFAAEENQLVVVRSRRDLMDRSVKLIQDLIANLQRAAEEALNAVGRFTTGLVTEAEHLRDKLLLNIEAFKKRISAAVETVYEKFSNTSSDVKGCVDSHRDQAAAVFEDTVSKTMVCVDKRISEISAMIQELKTIANAAIADAGAAMDGMKKCTEENTNLLSTGSCLGVLAMQTEFKSAGFLAQSTVMIGRINLAIAALPATMDMCAGKNLIQAGAQTGKIVVEIGTCSATAIFNNVTGKA